LARFSTRHHAADLGSTILSRMKSTSSSVVRRFMKQVGHIVSTGFGGAHRLTIPGLTIIIAVPGFDPPIGSEGE
jgi:hypothetical protein